MPFAITSDKVRLHYEEVGQGTPILFVHEFAVDHRGWEPQLREFGKRYRCIAYSARGYTPSDVPADRNAYSYQHVMRDCVAVLDHLKIDRRISSACRWAATRRCRSRSIIRKRVRSMVLAGTGSGSERWYTEQFHKHSRELGDQFEREGSAAVAKTYGNGPSRVPFAIKDARGFAEFAKQLAEHDAQGLGPYLARLSGRRGRRSTISRTASGSSTTPALIVVGDEDERCIEPSLFLKARHRRPPGLVMFPKTGHVVNLEEPDLFNQVVGDFLARVDAGRWPAARSALDGRGKP